MLYHLLCYDTLKSMIGGKESQITNINWYQTQSISTIPSSTQLLLILPITSLFLQQAVGTSSHGLTSQFIKSNALVANQADTRPFTTGTSSSASNTTVASCPLPTPLLFIRLPLQNIRILNDYSASTPALLHWVNIQPFWTCCVGSPSRTDSEISQTYSVSLSQHQCM